jgi:hypothetical protein
MPHGYLGLGGLFLTSLMMLAAGIEMVKKNFTLMGGRGPV